MRLNSLICNILASALITGCAHKGTNPADPYEPFNRKVHVFNMTFDKFILKPPAKLYRAVVPGPVRKSVNNFYNNLDMIPTVGNDILQAEGKWAIRDSWRFVINSTLGVAGLFDVASTFGLPLHGNDLGLTFAKWGDKKSPYVVLPFLGPSTIRDGSGWLFQFCLYSPYVYIKEDAVVYGLLGLRFIDIRAQYLETEPLLEQALDQYTFIRDAYLQHRQYLITGAEPDTNQTLVGDMEAESKPGTNSLGSDYIDE